MENKEYKDEITYPEGGIWEDCEFSLVVDFKPEYDIYNKCRHTRHDGTRPLLIVAQNEGGFNTTGVCALCIKEAVDAYLQRGVINKVEIM
jgi:hypothetical protein